MYVCRQTRLILVAICLLLFSTKTLASTETMVFPDACTPGNKIVIAAIGDLLMHQPLQQKASIKGYTSLWSNALPYFHSADLAYANLEGPIAKGVDRRGRQITNDDYFDQEIYSDYPLFNYHPKLARELAADGIKIVSTANNHALDRQGIGVNKTIDELRKAGVSFIGTRDKTSTPFVTLTEKNGIRLAWIACTEHTNGNEDKHQQVLYCYKKKHRAWILDKIAELKTSTDAIIVTPHWGEEYEHTPNAAQKRFAHQVLDAGALVVLGSHPHVLQPMEEYLTQDGRTTFIMYSLGNFVSNQASPKKRTTIILFIGLTKTQNSTVINGIRFVPMYMQNNTNLASLKLDQITQEERYEMANSILASLLPMGNATYSLPVITNPQCRIN